MPKVVGITGLGSGVFPDSRATHVSGDPGTDIESTLSALEASGFGRWEALGHVASSLDPSPALEAWNGLDCGYDPNAPHWKARALDWVARGAALDGIALWAPGLANRLLGEWLDKRCVDPARIDLSGRSWIASLPAGICFQGDLCVADCLGLETLPDGLAVGGNLDLEGCESLKQLPSGLRVGGAISLHGCRAGLGVPLDAHIGGGAYFM
jgi:hypothetical protein